VGPLEDRFGRAHTYLRVSVTDRCNYRCVYCMPAGGLSWQPKDEQLSSAEIIRLVQIFVGMGVQKVRLTGGEPTLRADLPALVEGLARLPGLRDLALSTNGHTLAALAPRLRAAGLHRVNISLDSLDPDRFRALTRGGDLARVLAGVDAALSAGLRPVKINAVLLRGHNDDEAPALVAWALERAPHLELRFIEYMPFEARWHQSVPAAELRRALAPRFPLEPDGPRGPLDGPARRFRVGPLKVGFISPLSEHFCATCNRLRLGSDGHLRTCLAHEDTPSLRDLLRGGADDAALAAAIRAMVAGKPEGHSALLDGGTPFEGVMTGIGG